jgi:ankyrin repeat protein
MGDTVLHTVCSWGDLTAVEILVSAGADVNARGDQGATPLFNAVIGESSKVVSCLLAAGADVRILNSYNRAVLDYARSTSAPLSILGLLENAVKEQTTKTARGRRE